MRRFFKWIVAASMAAAEKRRTKCPRQQALEILASQALTYTGATWVADGLRLVRTDCGSIVVHLLCEHGHPTDTLDLTRDPLVGQLWMKMHIAEQRSLRIA